MPESVPTYIVTAAVIEQDSRFFIAQRRRDDSFPGLWEFPGGKLEPGEAPEQALKRECQEELTIDIEVGKIRQVLHHQYDSFCVLLLFYDCKIIRGTPQAIGCECFEWVERANLNQYSFLPADRPLVEELMKG